MSIDTAARGLAAAGLAQNSAPYGGRLLHLSDSFAAQQTGSQGGTEVYKSPAGGAVWAEMLSLGRLSIDVANIKGVGGQTTDQIIARLGSDAMSRISAWDICLVDGGRNDNINLRSEGDHTIANLQAMANVIRKSSQPKQAIVMLPNPPRSLSVDNATARLIRAYVNKNMRDWCFANNVPFCDYWRDCADPTSSGGGAWATGMSGDTLHPNTTASRIIGQRILDTLNGLVPGTAGNQPAWDAYDPTYFPKGNAMAVGGATVPLLQGTGGTVSGTGVSGSVATGCGVILNAGAGTCVASKIAAPAAAGYGAIGTDKQRLVVSSIASTASWEFYGGFNVPAGLAGQQVVVEFLIELSGLSGAAGTYAAYGRGQPAGGNNGEFLSGAMIAAEKLLIRTPAHNIGNGGSFYQWAFGFFGTAGTAFTLDISNPVVRPQ
jgi:lysophospholipase L1-like esterase